MTPDELIIYFGGGLLTVLILYPLRDRLGCGGPAGGLALFFMWPVVLGCAMAANVWEGWRRLRSMW